MLPHSENTDSLERISDLDQFYQASLERFAGYSQIASSTSLLRQDLPIPRWTEVMKYHLDKDSAEKQHSRKKRKLKKKNKDPKKLAAIGDFSFPSCEEYLADSSREVEAGQDYIYDQLIRAWILQPLFPEAAKALKKKYEWDEEILKRFSSAKKDVDLLTASLQKHSEQVRDPKINDLSFVSYARDPLHSDQVRQRIGNAQSFQRFSKLKRLAKVLGDHPDLSEPIASSLYYCSVLLSDNRDFFQVYSVLFEHFPKLDSQERMLLFSLLSELLDEKAFVPDYAFEEQDVEMFTGYFETAEQSLGHTRRGGYLHTGIRQHGFHDDIEARTANKQRFRACFFTEAHVHRLLSLHGFDQEVAHAALEVLDEWFDGKPDYTDGFPLVLRFQINAAFALFKRYYERSVIFSEEFMEVAHREVCRDLSLDDLKKILVIWKTHMLDEKTLESWASKLFPDEQYPLMKITEVKRVLQMGKKIGFCYPTDMINSTTDMMYHASPYKDRIPEAALSSVYLGLCTEMTHV